MVSHATFNQVRHSSPFPVSENIINRFVCVRVGYLFYHDRLKVIYNLLMTFIVTCLWFRNVGGDICILEDMTRHYRTIEIRIKACRGKNISLENAKEIKA